jgi:hypothetical protein
VLEVVDGLASEAQSTPLFESSTGQSTKVRETGLTQCV